MAVTVKKGIILHKIKWRSRDNIKVVFSKKHFQHMACRNVGSLRHMPTVSCSHQEGYDGLDM
jgi:hypothetical protein